MADLVENLLSLGSLESGTLHIRREQESVEALVHDAVDLMQPIASAKSVQLRTEVTSVPPVLCERRLVGRVLANLIHNAIKFTPPGGVVTLIVRLRGPDVCLAVKDNGPGIPSEQLPHIFEQYWQETPGRGGTGLGLYICKGIAEAHGGEIGAESEVGGGTVVWFTLPMQPGAEAHTEGPVH
jgi:signal transduction histidine kinase